MKTPVSERIYVLRTKDPRYRSRGISHRYYTGGKPTKRIEHAKRFTIQGAFGAKRFARTGSEYVVVRVPEKIKFKMALQGI